MVQERDKCVVLHHRLPDPSIHDDDEVARWVVAAALGADYSSVDLHIVGHRRELPPDRRPEGATGRECLPLLCLWLSGEYWRSEGIRKRGNRKQSNRER